MSSTGSLFSQTLQEITNIKWDELAKKKDTFEKRQKVIEKAFESELDDVKRLETLSTNVKEIFSVSTTANGAVVRGSTNNHRLEIDLKNLDRFIAQARHDASVSSRSLESWQKTLLRHVHTQSLKYAFASLYGQLTTEWLASTESTVPSGLDHDMEDYEQVSGAKKLQSRRLWEEAVFTPTEVDSEAITRFLVELFEATPGGSKALQRATKKLRQSVKNFEQTLASSNYITLSSLRATIDGLQSSDLLTDQKRAVLRDFTFNEDILKEIADVLNMRMSAIQIWTWGDEVQLEQRRQLNGRFNIYMHEDLLQAIFLQHIGVEFSVFWKQTLDRFRRSKGVWKSARRNIPTEDKKRREFFLGSSDDQESVEDKKRILYRKRYFVSGLLETHHQGTTMEEGEEEANFDEYRDQSDGQADYQMQLLLQAQQAPQMPQQQMQRHVQSAYGQQAPQSYSHHIGPTGRESGRGSGRGGAKRHRKFLRDESDVDSEFEDEKHQDFSSEPRDPMKWKQGLLHLLSTDIAIKCHLNGEITCFRSQIEQLFPSLPHATIKTVLSFFGVSEKWRSFFERFLKAPLRFIGDDAEPRTRQRGTPGAHVLSGVFGEVILFCLDFAINQMKESNGEPLWRLHDDLWFWSADHAVCVTAWSTITKFNNLMGLKLNEARSGSARMEKDEDSKSITPVPADSSLPRGTIRWGMLFLNPESGRLEVDKDMVDDHVLELSRQLESKSSSIFSWIQTWNAYVAKFFTSNFGTPANCFGLEHIENMLDTHARIQKKIFAASSGHESAPTAHSSSGSVIEYLQQEIGKRFGIKDIPEGYFYFPTELGGLDVQSPFIGLLQIRDTVLKDPESLLQEFDAAERYAYATAKKDFESGKSHERRFERSDPNFMPKDSQRFFSFEEYIRHRETMAYGYDNELCDVFSKMLEQPSKESIDCDDSGTVKVSLNALNDNSLTGITSNWYNMSPYWKWVAAFYGPEMIDRFGGFRIVDPGLLPMGMINLLRKGKVKWQE